MFEALKKTFAKNDSPLPLNVETKDVSEDMNFTEVRCYIQGYGKISTKPICLFGIIDVKTGVIFIDSEKDYNKRTHSKKYLILTNDRYMDGRSYLFEESFLQDAIRAYYEFKDTLLELDPLLSRYNPEHAVQTLGLDEHGKKYSIEFETASNGIIAVLAICLFAKQQRTINNTLSFYDFDGTELDLDDDSVVSDYFSV